MGAGAAFSGKPRSPHELLNEENRRKARTGRYDDGESSELYKRCANGDIAGVREILEQPDRKNINDLMQIEPNGDTALHAAVKNKHQGVVKLLLEKRCPRNILDRDAKYAYEYADTPLLRNSFERNDSSSRFYDSDMTGKVNCYVHEETSSITALQSAATDSNANDTNVTENDLKTADTDSGFVRPFQNEKETYKYALDQQTTAMWLRFYSWLSRTFPSFFQHDFLRADTFDLDKNQDFKDFLKKRCKSKEADNTLDAINEAKTKSNIEPLIKMYTSEDACYRTLNQQLSNSTHEHESAPHLCDRFIMEFYIRSEQLEKRIFIGSTYRGATIGHDDIHVYEQALNNKTRGVLAFKTFTSTSEDIKIALSFIDEGPPKDGKMNVLFVITVNDKSTNIFGVSDVSDYPKEKEVLVMPDYISNLLPLASSSNSQTMIATTNIVTTDQLFPIIYKSSLRQYSTNDKVFDAIVCDLSGDIIIVAFNEEAGRSDNIMTLKKNITIQSGDVRMVNQKFNSSQSIYEIRLIPSSIINSYKSASFNPVIKIKQHQIINIYNLFHGSHVDVQGTIVYDDETTANISQSTGQSHTRRPIKIKDDTGSMNVTIWNEKVNSKKTIFLSTPFLSF
ncbi:unnamed protein product [Rotaria magnacalcarata]|uniref:Uncharacterized protein n=3 Tax=Rotaria magnacalcarata TaxID=392030 RepID=A0A819UEM9_9BILA|nr:unnamed protein product [Rotaria magnacalcarata]